jgi:phage-related protein/predicted XRE-type DNA-binding protein
MKPGTRHEAAIAWEGDSREVIRSFPEEIRAELGIELQLLQWGDEPRSYRPMPSIGSGVYELRQQDERSWYRIVYLARIDDVIHVLHCFEKKSAKTPRSDVRLARARLKMVQQRLIEKEKERRRQRRAMANPNKPTHMTYGSVLDDLGFSAEKAVVLKTKAQLHAALLRRAKKYTPKELQGILKEPQPRVSEFLNGKIASVSFEKMTVYAYRLGARPSIKLETVEKQRTRGTRASRGKSPVPAKVKAPASVAALG